MSSIRILAAASASLVFLAAAGAVAQETPVAVPPMTCENPGPAPIGPQGPAFVRFQKRVEDYKVCVNHYTAATGAKANEFAAQARAYTDAANKAIDDYNTYVTGLNESTRGGKQGAEKR